MDNETEKYYENYIEMFNTKGWKNFTEQLVEQQTGLRDGWASLDSSNDFFDVKGRLTVIDTILALEPSVRAGLEAVLAQEAEEDQRYADL